MNGKILIVGKNEESLVPTVRILEKEKYTVIMAFTLKETLRAIKDFEPHAVVNVIDSYSIYGIVVATKEDPTITNLKINLRKYPEIKKALQTKDMVIIRDVRKDPIMAKVRKYLEKIKFDSIMIIPIIYKEELIGTLMLRTSRIGSTFTEKEIRFCKVVANVSAGALYNAYLYEMMEEEKTRLQRLAITDFLTGIYNHRYFSHRLKEEFERVLRYNHPLSLIMVDITGSRLLTIPAVIEREIWF